MSLFAQVGDSTLTIPGADKNSMGINFLRPGVSS